MRILVEDNLADALWSVVQEALLLEALLLFRSVVAGLDLSPVRWYDNVGAENGAWP